MLPELCTISSAQPAWLSDIAQSYVADKTSTELLERLSTNPTSDSKFSLTAGILRIDNCVWVGAAPELHKQIVSAFHDSPLGGGALWFSSNLSPGRTALSLEGYVRVHQAVFTALSDLSASKTRTCCLSGIIAALAYAKTALGNGDNGLC